MLKKFFGHVLSSFMGTWIAMMLFVAVGAILIFSIVGNISLSSNNKGNTIKSNSVMQLSLSGIIEENENNIPFKYSGIISGNTQKKQALNKIISGLREGANNSDIKCLLIKAESVQASPATLHALRDAILEFKKSGKKIFAYGNSYSQGDYYVASVADKIILNPMGSVSITGLSGTNLYLKNFFDNIGVTFQVFKVGTYKSAVEPYLYNEMSEPARAQLDTLYRNMWNFISKEISDSRKLKNYTLDSLINKEIIMLQNAEIAKKYNLVDEVMTTREFSDYFADICNENEFNDINIVDANAIGSTINIINNLSSSNQIAVVYAYGEIIDGDVTAIDYNKFVPLITKLADNENVKALVLRVNSPGGSVFGSAEIADALNYFKSKNKPFIVSMGDYAASGGYWISCQADSIFADPLTITGSIGVFGVVPQIEGLLHKIGVSPQTVATNPNGVTPSLFNPFTPAQSVAMQQSVEDIYSQFVKRVAKGRNISENSVRKIAEGRVWDGETALRLKLIDRLGSLDNAINSAAKMAKITGDETVVCYPEAEDEFWQMISKIQTDATYSLLLKAMGTNADMTNVETIHHILTRNPRQALAPIIMFNF